MTARLREVDAWIESRERERERERPLNQYSDKSPCVHFLSLLVFEPLCVIGPHTYECPTVTMGSVDHP